jgi:hypothetical protein
MTMGAVCMLMMLAGIPLSASQSGNQSIGQRITHSVTHAANFSKTCISKSIDRPIKQ